MFNIISLVMSVMALVASTWGVVRQIGRARADSDLAMTTEVLLTHIRDPAFQRDQRWVLFELASHHSPDQGIDLLPGDAKYRAWNVAFVFESISIMMRFDIVNSEILTSLTHHRLMRTWEVLEPYIRAERARRGSVVFPFFEDAYATARRTDPEALHRRLGLKAADGRPR
ncbi:hypothetical protein AB0F46_13115 [Streptomyces sp. NPDC026665]|uniref:DUF4760 domain-containing protein n=1 Tax=unclassified Streptomyces TaxID=2593676 RepID=UPI0033F576A2